VTDRTNWMAGSEPTRASIDFAIEQAKLVFAPAIERLDVFGNGATPMPGPEGAVPMPTEEQE